MKTISKLSLLFTLGLLLVSCTPQQEPEPEGPTGTAVNPNWQTDINTTSNYLTALLEGQYDVASGLVQDTFMTQGPSADAIGDFDAVVTFWTNTAQIYTDRTMQHVSYSVRVVENENPDLIGDWVFHWGEFVGTLISNGEQVVVPFHLSMKMVDGKIALQNSYYDNLSVQQAMSR